MKKLSKGEWIAVVVAMVFTSYTLFGNNIKNLFEKNSTGWDSVAATIREASNDEVIINDMVIGQGPEVKQGDLISVHFILSLSDGTVIENSKDFGQPLQFVLGTDEFFPGWGAGFRNMKVGGVRNIVIPAELVYGPNQTSPIPPNSTLILTIELLNVSPAPTASIPELIQ